MPIKFQVNRPLFNLTFLSKEQKDRERIQNRRLETSAIMEARENEYQQKISTVEQADNISEYDKTIAQSAIQKQYKPQEYQEGMLSRIGALQGFMSQMDEIKRGQLGAIGEDLTEFVQHGTNRSLTKIYDFINKDVFHGVRGGRPTQGALDKISGDYIGRIHSEIAKDPTVPTWIKDGLTGGDLSPEVRAAVSKWDNDRGGKGKYESSYLQLVSAGKVGQSIGDVSRGEARDTSTAISKLNAEFGSLGDRGNIAAWIAKPANVAETLTKLKDAISEVSPSNGGEFDVGGFISGVDESRIDELGNDPAKMLRLQKQHPDLATLILQYRALKRGDEGTFIDMVIQQRQGSRLPSLEDLNRISNRPGVDLTKPINLKQYLD